MNGFDEDDKDEETSGREDPPAGRRATIGLEARELAGEFGEAVDETRDAIRDRVRADAGRLRRVSDLFSQGVVAFLLALHLGATAVLTAVVFSGSFPYPYMYLAMGLLLWGVFTMRFRALGAGRHAAATRSALVNILLTSFWVVILADQVAGRPVVAGSLRMRPDVPAIWISVAMYVAAQAGMVVHGAVNRFRRRRSGV